MSTETKPPKIEIPPSPMKMQHDYVLLVRIKDPSKGFRIITSDKSTDERYDCYVVDVGPGRITDQALPDGTPVINKPTVKRGDKVVFNAPQCKPFELFGYMFIICPNFQVFGVIDETNYTWLESHQASQLLTANGKISG